MPDEAWLPSFIATQDSPGKIDIVTHPPQARPSELARDPGRRDDPQTSAQERAPRRRLKAEHFLAGFRPARR